MVDGSQLTDLELLDLQIAALFRVDAAGRLRAINEPGAPPAPRFFLGRTAAGQRWRARFDLPAQTLARLADVCRAAPDAADTVALLAQDEALRAVLQEHAPIADEDRGPAFWAPPMDVVPAQIVLLAAPDAAAVRETFPWLVEWLADPANGPVTAVVDHGSAVAVCFCSRITARAAEAGVVTLPAFRVKGYATAAVAGWCRAVQRSGRLALYSTSWENRASQAVARKLGLVRYGEDWSIR